MTLDLSSNPIFSGNTSRAPRAWMLVPEFGFAVDSQIVLEHSELKGFLDGKIPEEIEDFWKDKKFGGFSGIGHFSLNFDIIVNRGLEDILKRIETFEDSVTEDSHVFREAMKISIYAVVDWAKRYADEAEKLAAVEADPQIAMCLKRIAHACRKVPFKPADNYFEVLQSVVLVHLASVIEGQGLSVSLGGLDRAMCRFASEVDSNYEEAVNFTRAFILKVAANSFHGKGSKTQAVTVGGCDSEGNDLCNSITKVFLDAFRFTPVNDPHLFCVGMKKLMKMLFAKLTICLLQADQCQCL